MWRGARPSRTTLDSAKTLIRPVAIGGRHIGFAPRGATKTAARGRLGAYDPPLSFYAVKRHQKTAPPGRHKPESLRPRAAARGGTLSDVIRQRRRSGLSRPEIVRAMRLSSESVQRHPRLRPLRGAGLAGGWSGSSIGASGSSNPMAAAFSGSPRTASPGPRSSSAPGNGEVYLQSYRRAQLDEVMRMGGGAWGTATSPAEHSSGWADDLSV